MTIDELIAELQQLSNDGHGDATVMMAYQPSWPLQCSLSQVKLHGTHSADIEECESFIFNNEAKKQFPDDVATARAQLEKFQEMNEYKLYICEGGNNGYAPEGLF